MNRHRKKGEIIGGGPGHVALCANRNSIHLCVGTWKCLLLTPNTSGRAQSDNRAIITTLQPLKGTAHCPLVSQKLPQLDGMSGSGKNLFQCLHEWFSIVLTQTEKKTLIILLLHLFLQVQMSTVNSVKTHSSLLDSAHLLLSYIFIRSDLLSLSVWIWYQKLCRMQKLKGEENSSRSKTGVTFESEGGGNGGWECWSECSTSSERRGILPSCFLWVREMERIEGGRKRERERKREVTACLKLSFPSKQHDHRKMSATQPTHPFKEDHYTLSTVRGLVLLLNCSESSSHKLSALCAQFQLLYEPGCRRQDDHRPSSKDQESHTEEGGQNKVTIDTKQRKKRDPQLSSHNPLPSSLFLSVSLRHPLLRSSV